MGERIIIFAQPTVGWVPPLLNAFLEELGKRQDVDWVKICATSADVSRAGLAARSLTRFAAKALFNPGMALGFDLPQFTTVTSVANKFGVEIIRPPQYKINDPNFIRELAENHAPTMTLSLACLQIWSADLLKVTGLAVNFHDGYLPDYKGLWATHWSVYQGEEYSGYAFHVMDEKIDTGPIIIRGRVPVGPKDSPAAVARRKIRSAITQIDALLATMVERRFESLPQPKGGSYFSGKASVRVWTIDDPARLSAEEFSHRLQCFAPLKVQISGVRYPVTSVKPAGAKRPPLSFITADGVTLYPDRLQYVPTRLYLAATRLRQALTQRRHWRRQSDPPT